MPLSEPLQASERLRRRWRDLSVLAAVLVPLALTLALLAAPLALAQKANVANRSGPPATKAERAVLMDAESGAIIYQQNADDLAPPFGLSKLMTLALAFKALDEGRVKPDDPVRMSVNAWRTGGAMSKWTPMYVRPNTSEPFEVLLQGVVVQSGNDAAIAIAEHLSGSEAKFAEAMTAEARRLGLDKATFSNATGMPTSDQGITARELALLARHLMRTYPHHYHRFSQKDLVYTRFRFGNDNPLLGTLGVDGLKTGFVKNNSFGLVASGNKDGRRLILVIAGLSRIQDVKPEATKLLEWGFEALHNVMIYEAGEVVTQARVWGGDRMWLPLVGDGPISIVLPRFPANQKLSAEVIYMRPLKMPIAKGDKVATLRVTSSSKAVSEVPLYAGVAVQPGGIVRRGIDTIFHHTLGWAL